MGRVLQSAGCLEWVFAGWLSSCLAVALLLIEFRNGWAVYATAWTAVMWWVLGSAQLLWLRPPDWITPSPRLHWAATAMGCGVLTLALHTVLAVDALGGHTAAVEHTRRTAGVGWGVYVNYLFAAVWLADTVWLTAAMRSYARRLRWVGYAVHGFLAFVVFNATVVYGEAATRLAGGVWFGILACSWWRRRFRIVARSASEGQASPR